jgi:nucleoside-diphosphate-sugar epimerase
MTNHLLIFGMGYTSSHLAAHLRKAGWRVTGSRRAADSDNIAFEDTAAVHAALSDATHILSSVPPSRDGDDPVLIQYGDAIKTAGAVWAGYLSSTGVYGDAGGAWVDESGAVAGRRAGRNAADLAWQDLRADMRVFRLPGIYGPGRSALDRVSEGKAHRIDLPSQVFSRVHVDDIVSGVTASFAGPAGVYNLADDYPCGQNQVIEAACDLLGLPYPPLQSLDDAKRLLGWTPQYANYRAGLAACMAMNIPAITSAAPLAASIDQT